MTLWGALAGGCVGTIVLTSGLRVAQELGLDADGHPAAARDRLHRQPRPRDVIGYALHFVNGLAFALGYYAIFRAVDQAGWRFGAALGVVHAAFAGGGS